MSIKQKTINGTKWALIDNVMNLGYAFVINLFLARILMPSDYGLIGMTTFIIALMRVFVKSGFSFSIIRTKEATQYDYSTIFYVNIAICVVAYFILFFTAPLVAIFFDKQILTSIIRVLGLSLIIEGFSVVQNAIRIKELNYKIQAKITIVGTCVGGTVALIMAYMGFGVWSIVAQSLIIAFVNSSLYWITSKWRPIRVFSKEHLKKHWAYSMSLLRNDITLVVFDNLYYIAIGKYYSAESLGQFTKARNFIDIVSVTLTRILSNGVSFPVLCSVGENLVELRRLFNRFFKLIIFVSCSATFLFAAISDSFILFVIGEKWENVPLYIKILSVSAFLYPINMYNISIARVIGETKVFANAILFQRILIIPVVILGVLTNIEVMIWGASFTAIAALVYNMAKVKELINISIEEQCLSIVRIVWMPLLVALSVYFIGVIVSSIGYALTLFIQVVVALIMFFGLMEFSKNAEYTELKAIVFNQISKLRIKK